MNYADHCLEQNIPPPKEPVVFSKFSSAIIGPYDDLKYPEVTEVRMNFCVPRYSSILFDFETADIFNDIIFPLNLPAAT